MTCLYFLLRKEEEFSLEHAIYTREQQMAYFLLNFELLLQTAVAKTVFKTPYKIIMFLFSKRNVLFEYYYSIFLQYS